MFIVKDLNAMARQVSPGRTLECHGLLDCAQNIDAPEAQLARHMKALGAYTNAGGADCRLHVDPLFTYLYIPSIADSAPHAVIGGNSEDFTERTRAEAGNDKNRKLRLIAQCRLDTLK
jgi:hypothetical protein